MISSLLGFLEFRFRIRSILHNFVRSILTCFEVTLHHQCLNSISQVSIRNDHSRVTSQCMDGSPTSKFHTASPPKVFKG